MILTNNDNQVTNAYGILQYIYYDDTGSQWYEMRIMIVSMSENSDTNENHDYNNENKI